MKLVGKAGTRERIKIEDRIVNLVCCCGIEFSMYKGRYQSLLNMGQKKFFHNHKCFLKNSEEHKKARKFFSKEAIAMSLGVFDND